MKNLVDVVNLNADASCLSSAWWLEILQGGKESYFCQWLSAYSEQNKKVSLGITGATVSDIANFNPEAIELINTNRQVFEIVLRPYAHDIGLLRTRAGFLKNLETGMKVLTKEFGSYTNYFLPPEFMLTNEQLMILEQSGVAGTFINPVRFKQEIKLRLPSQPYLIKGLLDSEIKCIPFHEQLTNAYLDSIHVFDNKSWNGVIERSEAKNLYSWRDGESSFFLPNGNKREAGWLKRESKKINRIFLSESDRETNFLPNQDLVERKYHYYPVHSFTAWVKEFRMMGFISKIERIENEFPKLSTQSASLWLQVINSDILSAIEKDSPLVSIKLSAKASRKTKHTIWRSERGVEGEEILFMLENNKLDYWKNSKRPHARKLSRRIDYLERF